MSNLLMVVAWVSLATACGDNLKHSEIGANAPDASNANNASMPDAYVPPGPCWFDTYTPGGSIQLGTGFPFVAMPDVVQVVFGSQSGWGIPVNARITGLLPGNPADPLDPRNPHTRFHGFYVDTGEAINPGRCGSSVGYMPSVGSSYDLALLSGIPFDSSVTTDQIFGRQVHIVLEIIDSAGNYAMDEKDVTCAMPDNWPPM